MLSVVHFSPLKPAKCELKVKKFIVDRIEKSSSEKDFMIITMVSGSVVYNLIKV